MEFIFNVGLQKRKCLFFRHTEVTAVNDCSFVRSNVLISFPLTQNATLYEQKRWNETNKRRNFITQKWGEFLFGNIFAIGQVIFEI